MDFLQQDFASQLGGFIFTSQEVIVMSDLEHFP